MEIKKRLILTLVLISAITLLAIAGLMVVLVDGVQAFGTDFDITYTSAYKVSFNVSGAANQSVYDNITFDDTYTIATEPEVPQIHNKMLEGWYLDSCFTQLASFPLTKTMGNINLYPKLLEGTISDWIEWNTNGYYQVKSGKYTGTETNIVIPDYYDDGTHGLNAVTTLAGTGTSSLLYVNTSVNGVWVGNNITAIPNRFANEAVALKTIVIGKGVTSIGAYAFHSTSEVTSIVYNAVNCADITTNAQYLFTYCGETYGTTLTIGSSVKNIPARLFCPYTSQDDVPNIIGSIVIPDSVESIGHYAFWYQDSVTSLTIGEGVTSIGYSVFTGTNSVTSLTYNAINCADLESDSSVFYSMGDGGTTLTIGNKVEHIPAYLFYATDDTTEYLPNLIGSIKIPDSVTSIGAYAFCSQDAITSITIGEGVASIGDYAFNGATSVMSLTYNAVNCSDLSGDNYVFGSLGIGGSGCTLTIGNEVQSIPAYLFCPQGGDSDVNLIDSIVIPDSVTYIGSYAIYKQDSIDSITIGKGVQSIGKYAFYQATSVTSLVYNATNCADLTSSNYVFDDLGLNNGCSLTIGNSVQSIPAYIFDPYSNSGYVPNFIGSIVIPDSVISIGTYAFYYQDAITSLTIGKGVTSIGTSAFRYAKALDYLYYNATKCEDFATSNYTFAYCGTSSNKIAVTIGANVTHVPANLFYAYSSASYRPYVSSITFEAGSVCEYIGDNAFRVQSNTSADLSVNMNGNVDNWYYTSSKLAEGAEVTGTAISSTNMASTSLFSSTTYSGNYLYRKKS